jgi:hypothetical protein
MRGATKRSQLTKLIVCFWRINDCLKKASAHRGWMTPFSVSTGLCFDRELSRNTRTVRVSEIPRSSFHFLLLEFVTIPERGLIFPRTALFELLTTFPGLLRTKNLKRNASYALGSGCPMVIPYPGKMIAGLTPCLRDRPPDLWPEVFLRIVPTGQLVSRARTAVKFAQDLDLINNGPS